MLRLYCGSAVAYPKKISLRLNPDCLFAKPHPQVHHLRFTMTSTCPSWWTAFLGRSSLSIFKVLTQNFLTEKYQRAQRLCLVRGWNISINGEMVQKLFDRLRAHVRRCRFW